MRLVKTNNSECDHLSAGVLATFQFDNQADTVSTKLDFSYQTTDAVCVFANDVGDIKAGNVSVETIDYITYITPGIVRQMAHLSDDCLSNTKLLVYKNQTCFRSARSQFCPQISAIDQSSVVSTSMLIEDVEGNEHPHFDQNMLLTLSASTLQICSSFSIYAILAETVIRNVSIRLTLLVNGELVALHTSTHLYEQPDVYNGYAYVGASVAENRISVTPLYN